MKRFFVILVAQFVVIGAAAFLGSWAYARWHGASNGSVGDEMSWFQSQLGLNKEQAAQLEGIHQRFLDEQARLCEQHCSKRFELGELIKQSDALTPRIEQLATELAGLEAKSQRITIQHIFEVGKQLSAAQRQKFVAKVYDQICSSCPMGSHRPAPDKQASCGQSSCDSSGDGCCQASNTDAPSPARPCASLPAPQPRPVFSVVTLTSPIFHLYENASSEANFSEFFSCVSASKIVLFSVFRI